GDVLAEPADERLPRFFDGAARGERLRAEVGGGPRLEGDVAHGLGELHEIFVAGREVRLDVDLDEHPALPVRREARHDEALRRDRAGALRALRETLLENDLDGLLHVAVGLGERAAAVVEARLGAIPKLLHLLHADLSHSRLSSRTRRSSLRRDRHSNVLNRKQLSRRTHLAKIARETGEPGRSRSRVRSARTGAPRQRISYWIPK